MSGTLVCKRALRYRACRKGSAYRVVRTAAGQCERVYGCDVDVENRIAEWTMGPEVSGEGIHVLRYFNTSPTADPEP